ncbi:MAG: hypothetical protein JOZ32_08820 [Bryobacterales bacterium]|nr:hypothetical protein [Bryobacterales bacterium]
MPVGSALGQTASQTPSKTGKAWTDPKTPWGTPDLQGTWTSDDTWGVPFERPKQFGTRATLTEDELKAREKNVEHSEEFVENGGGDNHSPAKAQIDAAAKGEAAPAPKGRFGRGVDAAPVPGHWGEFARRASHQTSQIVDPPDGRLPPLTPEAQAKMDAKNKLRRDPIPASYENWSRYDRCITRGVAGSILPVIYGNGLEIVQTPGYVAIRYEMVHDVRIIPTDGRPHLSSNIRSYMGDAVGHWEGNTLVVETTNLLGDRMAIGANGDGGPPYSEDMKLTERFTRVSPNTINYEMTVDDPKTYTATWKVAFPITHEPGYQLFEYACHEGNMAMHNMLSAARAEDKKAASAITK